MRVHDLKILNYFADSVFTGNKTFEIRKNDRGYQKGDYIRFFAVDEQHRESFHPIEQDLYKIIYVISGFGLKNGYVALGIQRTEISSNDCLEV